MAQKRQLNKKTGVGPPQPQPGQFPVRRLPWGVGEMPPKYMGEVPNEYTHCQTLPFADVPPPCDLDYGRDTKLFHRSGSAPLSIEDGGGVLPYRFIPVWFGNQGDPFLYCVPVEVTIPNGYIGYSVDYHAWVNEVAWSRAVQFQLYVNERALGDHFLHTEEMTHVPIRGKAKGGSRIRIGARIRPENAPGGFPVVKDRLDAHVLLRVLVYSEQNISPRPFNSCDCKE